MVNGELISKILSSTWCTIPSWWDYTLRSNRFLKLLDLSHPETYGIHVAYHLLNDYVNYVLVVLPQGTDVSSIVADVPDFARSVYTENNCIHVVFYRKELDTSE